MRKLHVKIENEWRMVFARDTIRNAILTTKDKSKALPTKAFWGESDLVWFQSKFADHDFQLKKPE